MVSLNENDFPANASLNQRVLMLIIGRLVAIFLLLVSSWIWYSGSTEFTLQSIPQSTLFIFIISVGLTVVYFFLLRIGSLLQWQIRFQFLLDALLITWLIWRTGDLTSPYITLYIVLISVSSVFLRPRSTILMAFLCIGLFCGLAILTGFTIIDSFGIPQTRAKVVQILSFHAVAFFVVGLLASRLADRQKSGEELREATKSLASLRALHERIIESIRSGLVTTDLDGTIFTFNAAASEITGYTAAQVKGSSIFDLMPGIRISLQDASLESSEVQSRYESDLTTPDGFVVRIGYSVARLFSEENEASGYILTFQDLTEIRSMEQSIRRKDRLAAVGRVGAGLAHEIRNPLGAMRGAIQVLESSMPPNSIQTDLMGIILRESDRLNSIITNFLSYAKPKVGNFSELDLRESIRDTVTLLRHSPDVKETHTITENLSNQPIFVSADQTQIQQVFWNLARNAIQAMPDGGELTISLDHGVGDRARIVIADTGKGMPPEQVEQLFEPFAKSTTGGTGLGLSIVYQIIRDHNGTINVRSAEEEGTTITIELRREPISAHPDVDDGSDEGQSPIESFLRVAKSDNEDNA
ncbi:MAG TPA: ATP-binding protein [Pyrinomonadaceae bacterium]|nr:ATP-binding protein [Pyrinomonadaceae bacterium]